MNRINGVAALPLGKEEGLRKTARQLEGVFVEQLLKSMRSTVTHDGILDGGAGEELFTGMMDQHVAGLMPSQWKHGLASAIARELGPVIPSNARDLHVAGVKP
jgi:flagellar protein FlgJ